MKSASIAQARPVTDDAFARVLDLGDRSSGSHLAAVTVVALVLHGAVAAQAMTMSFEIREYSRRVRERVAVRLQDLYDVDLAKPPEPPPPPPPEVKEDKPAPAPPPPAAKAAEPPPAPPPAPAQAGKVLTQEPDPNEPVDMTAGGFVTGNADSYAGGITERTGTSKTAVTNRAAQPGGSPTGTGTAAPQAPAVDKSRSAGLLGSTDWNCSSFWPAEADSEQIDQALVTIQVSVGPDGKATRVDIVKDPGHGFGLAARRCALRESFQVGLDKDGNPIASQTKPFRVRFER